MPIFDEDDIDTGYDLGQSKFIRNIRQEALGCMDVFFCDKGYWAGGSIAKSKLYKEEHIKAVMEINVMDALALSYYCLVKSKPDTVDVSKKGWDFELCYECLKQCAKRFIPKCHAGGILLVYLSLCHGVDFIPTLKKLNEIKVMIARQEREAEIESLQAQQELEDDDFGTKT